MNQNHAEELRDKLNQAMAQTLSQRGSYTDDIRNMTRNRKLPPITLTKIILTMTGGTLQRELYDMYNGTIYISPSSFVDRRKQLGYHALYDIMLLFNELSNDPATLNGYRLLACDGSTVPLPRNENSKNHYKSESNPRGFNNLHCNILFDILNYIFVDCYVGEGDSRRSHDEQGALYSLIYKRKFSQPSILLLDRGYESYNSIKHLQSISNLFFVLRVKNDGLRPVRELPKGEEIDTFLEWVISTRQTKFSKAQGDIFIPTGSLKGKENSPKTKERITRWDFDHIDGKHQYRHPMKCRAVRLILDTGQQETLLTNLPPEEFSISDLKQLYSLRWKIELSIRFWKYAVGALALHSRTDELILQELFAHLTMFNFCQRIIREIKIEQKPGRKYQYQIDRTMAIYLCKKFFREPDFTGKKLIEDIKRYVCPVRPNRTSGRDIKVKPATPFPYRIPS